MSYKVLLLDEAVKDIAVIYRYIRKPGSKRDANGYGHKFSEISSYFERNPASQPSAQATAPRNILILLA
jgi:hypothetical protein